MNIYRHPKGDVHAPLNLSLEDAKRWYDAHCERVGRAKVGEDSHGIWVNGESELEDGEVFLSGDWRSDNGGLELISFLVVENPGYPTAMVASETQTALTSAGIVTASDRMVDRIARLEKALFGSPEDELAEYFEVAELAESFGLP
ncbi:MAG: hypothetical protein U5Q03_15010 [Bacteroidota bacterium]|nr:hypothetical protein [Bacteroidota bacterium]